MRVHAPAQSKMRMVALALGATSLALFLGSFSVPLLLAAGERSFSGAVFSLYGLICHQMPERSYFIAGEQVAVCQRYLAIFAGGMGGSLWLARGSAEGIGLRAYLVASLPLALDGATQLVGWRESTAVLRTVTGLLFGAASIAYWSPLVANVIARLARR